MSVSKRSGTDQPLTEHDIAERLDRAAIRVVRIMYDLRVNHPELLGPVRQSRYLTNAVNLLAYELQHPDWEVTPAGLPDE